MGVSSPSGDVEGAEAAAAVVARLAPGAATVERVDCSTPDHARDLILRLRGAGTRKLVLVGHIDTVISHAGHRPLARDSEHPGRLVGSGTVDMKGGVVLSLGVLRALAARPEDFAEVALLLVCDEEWRTGPFAHAARFAGFDASLCFEAGELTAEGEEAVVVKRKAAGTLDVRAHGRSAHSGTAPDSGANALLALAAAAQAVAAWHAPNGANHMTAVPTVLRSGDAFNVVPGDGKLVCDLRADDIAAFEALVEGLPDEVGGARLESVLARRWPGMDSRALTAPLLEDAGARLGRPIVGVDRGGASDASHFAPVVPITVDGLGPRGGGAHAPGEYVLEESLHTRAEVALALVDAVLAS